MKLKFIFHFLFTLFIINNISAQTTYIITADDSAPITLYDNTIFVVDAGQSYVLSGVISGGYSVTKSGEGTLVLTAENTYTGTTTIEDGILQLGDAGGTGSISGAIDIEVGGTLAFHRNDHSVNLGDIVISNTLSGPGDIVFRGTNTINQSSYKCTGSSASFTGAVNIEGGSRLILEGSVSSATNAITVENGSTVYLAASHTYSNPLTIAGNGWQESAGQLGALRLGNGANHTGGIVLTEDSRIGIKNAGATISGIINGAFGIEKYDDGKLTLSGANTYTGATIVTAGILFISGNGLVEQSAGIGVVSGATFDISNITASSALIKELSGAGSVILGAKDMTVGSANTSTIFSGTISGTGNITKTGTGTLTLSGVNTYSGSTHLEAGRIDLGNASGLGVGEVTMDGSTTLGFNGNYAVYNDIVLSGDATLDTKANLLTLEGTVDGAYSLTKTGTGILTFGNNIGGVSALSSMTIQQGTVNIVDGSQLIASNTVDIRSGAALGLVANVSQESIRADAVTFASGSMLDITGYTGTGTVTIIATNTMMSALPAYTIANQPTTDYLSSGLQLANSNKDIQTTVGLRWYSTANNRLAIGDFTIASGETFTLGTVLADNSGSTNRGLNQAGLIWDGNTLTKYGDGTLTLTGANTFTGTTTINAGEVLLSNPVALTQSPVILTTGTTLGTTMSAAIQSLTANNSTIDPTGTLTINTNASLDNAIINITLSLGNISDKVNVTNSVSYGANNTIIKLTSWQTGSFIIMSAANGLDVSKYTLQLNGAAIPADYSAVLSVSGNDLILTTTKQISASDITIDNIPPVTYSGQPQTPALTIKDNGTLLTEDTDYTLDYGTDNTNAGIVTVTITGIGTYSGTTTKHFTIKPKDITVTALSGSSTYGDSPTNPGISCSDLVNGETVSVLTGLKNSFGITATTSASATPYTLIVTGSLTNTNYTVTHTVDGSWTVNPKDVTVTALGGSSTYGDNPPNPGISCSDLVNGETVSVLTGLSNSFGITSITAASTTPYVLTVEGSLTNTNYTISNIVDGSWTVKPKSISVTADDKTKNFGQPNPTFTYNVNPALINGDQMSGELTCTEEAAGQWPILQGTLTAGSNYTITYTAGTLTILSTNTDITAITVDGEAANRSGNSFSIITTCGENEAVIDVIADANETVAINGIQQNPYTLNLPNYGDNTIIITVTAQNGTSQTYTLTVNKPVPFDQVVKMRWNNTLTVINNPAGNGDYKFTAYKWFRNGQQISTEQSWSAGADGTKLNPADLYYVELTANGIPGTLRTCETTVSLRSMEIKAYPNPVSTGQTLYVEADVDDELLKDAVIEVYNVAGNCVGQMKVQGRLTPVGIHYAASIHFFVFKGKDGLTKELKVVVK